MTDKILMVIAKAAEKTAKSAANSASFFGMHQPKEPECVKKLKKARD